MTTHRLAPGLALVVLLVAVAGAQACASDPPPKKEPPKCPKVERGTDTVVEEVLCANADADQDGVDDAVDLCPEAAEVRNGEADLDGCPDPDRDQDLLVDFEDPCPDEAGPLPSGCPVADADGDGLPDHLDACPNKAEDLDGEDDADGCPEGDRKLGAGEVAVLWRESTVEMRRGKPDPTEAGARELATLTDGAVERVGVVISVTIEATAGLREEKRKRALDLAAARAARVREAFLVAGIPPSRISTTTTALEGKAAGDTGAAIVRVEIAAPLDAPPGPADGGVDEPAAPLGDAGVPF